MPLQTLSAIVGVAKQGSRGTLAANPTFAHGVSGGATIAVEPSQSYVEVTAAARAYSNVMRESVMASASIESPAYMRTLGLYLLGALGSVTTTGASPYVHTFATGDLPYLSAFTKGIDNTIEAIRDCKVDELTLKWEGAKPLELAVKMQGTVFSYPVGFTATTDETGSEAWLVPVGGTFEYDPIGSSLAAARVVGGELTIKNGVEPVQLSGAIQASDIVEKRQEHELKLTIVPDDLTDFRKVITGASNGSGPSATAPTGSVNLVFKQNNGAGQLAVTGSKVAFLCAFPDADPAGGPVEIEMAGTALMPAGGTAPLVYALTNTQATY